MIILAVRTAKILWRVETGKKNIQIANQCLPAKYIRDLREHKMKTIAIVKRAMTKDNVLAYTKPKK